MSKPWIAALVVLASAVPAYAELGFAPPPGYSVKRENGAIALMPDKVDDKTPCAYGIGAPRKSTGSLESDATAALGELIGNQWRLKWQDQFTRRSGISAAGWSFYYLRTVIVPAGSGPGAHDANVMAMALTGANGTTNLIYGLGGFNCTLEDASFVHLFHSLRPEGVASDRGKAISKPLAGYTWRMTLGGGGGPSIMVQYTFAPNGRYWRGSGTVTQLGFYETTTTTASDGSWAIRDGLLVLTPDRKGSVERFRVRVWDEPFVGNDWKRKVGMMRDNHESELWRIDG